MRRRDLWLVGLLIVVGASVVLGNVPPTMDDQYVTTVQDTPVTFELRARDEDIDPTDPDAHPLRFVLLEGPSNGVLIGDMAEVRYEASHDALVELTYVPAVGFVGTDLLTIAVFDPFDETVSGTITIQIDVTERRAEMLLSGHWTMGATFLPQVGSFTAFSSQLTEVYRVGVLTMKGIAQMRKAQVGGVEEIVFDTLRFDGDIKLGTLSLASTLVFDPEAPMPADTFDYWRASVGFALQGVDFRYTLYLARPLTSSYQTLHARATAGGLSITNTLRFDVNDECLFAFSGSNAVIWWSWCDLKMRATLAVTCTGFQQVKLSVSEVPIPVFDSQITLDAGLTFTVNAKTLSMSLDWRPLTSGCIRVYSELEAGEAHNVGIEGISIYGLKLEYDIGGVRVVSATSLDPAKNSSVTGQTDYFEVVRMSGTLMSCCGAPGTWGIATYFHNNSMQLFDWGMLTGAFHLGLSEHVSANLELVLRSGDLGDPTVELSFGFAVRW